LIGTEFSSRYIRFIFICSRCFCLFHFLSIMESAFFIYDSPGRIRNLCLAFWSTQPVVLLLSYNLSPSGRISSSLVGKLPMDWKLSQLFVGADLLRSSTLLRTLPMFKCSWNEFHFLFRWMPFILDFWARRK
jgi:hypothetical protein